MELNEERTPDAAEQPAGPLLHANRMSERQEIVSLVGLFLLLRLMMPFWFTPLYSEFSDFLFHFMRLSEPSFIGENVNPALPFIDYWLEYPPVFPWLALGVFKLQTLFWGFGPHAHMLFNALMSLLMGLADAVNLVFVYLLAKMIRGHRFAMGASWAYGLLFFPLVLTASYFDSLVLMLVLISLYLMIKDKPLAGGILLGLGFMMKMIPAALVITGAKYVGKKIHDTISTEEQGSEPAPRLDLGAKILSYFQRGRTPRDANKLLAFFFSSFLVVAVIAATFAMLNFNNFAAPFVLLTKRPPWETLQAVVAGQTGFGHIGPTEKYLNENPGFFHDIPSEHVPVIRRKFTDLPRARQAQIASRFTTNFDYMPDVRSPLQLPITVVVAFSLITALVWFPSRADALNMTGITAITLCLMFIAFRGWSPQFIIYILPFVLFLLPAGVNIVLAILLSAVNFLELPVWLAFHLQQYPSANTILYIVVIMRPLVLLLIIAAIAWTVANANIHARALEEGADSMSG